MLTIPGASTNRTQNHSYIGYGARITGSYNGLETAQVGARGQAVRVFFQTGGHVDVAPVFSYGSDIYVLPNGSGGCGRSPIVGPRGFRATGD